MQLILALFQANFAGDVRLASYVLGITALIGGWVGSYFASRQGTKDAIQYHDRRITDLELWQKDAVKDISRIDVGLARVEGRLNGKAH